jgi:hypothetical protein
MPSLLRKAQLLVEFPQPREDRLKYYDGAWTIPYVPAFCTVYRNGVLMHRDLDYTRVADLVTFTGQPEVDENEIIVAVGYE